MGSGTIHAVAEEQGGGGRETPSHGNAHPLSKANRLSNDLIQCARSISNTHHTVTSTEEDE